MGSRSKEYKLLCVHILDHSLCKPKWKANQPNKKSAQWIIYCTATVRGGVSCHYSLPPGGSDELVGFITKYKRWWVYFLTLSKYWFVCIKLGMEIISETRFVGRTQGMKTFPHIAFLFPWKIDTNPFLHWWKLQSRVAWDLSVASQAVCFFACFPFETDGLSWLVLLCHLVNEMKEHCLMLLVLQQGFCMHLGLKGTLFQPVQW